ncbi:r3h domain [Moniliophthora roreri]|nr:r3h domain [Moniliophthora roreri]
MGFRTQVSSRKSSSECLEHSGALIQLSVLFHHRKQLYPRIPSPRRLPTPTSDGIRTLSVRPSGSTHWFFRDLRVLYHYPLSLAALDDELSVHRPSRVSYQFRLQKESSNRLLPIGSSLRSTPVQSFLVQISIAASGASFRTDTVHGGRLSGSNQVVTFWGYDSLLFF